MQIRYNAGGNGVKFNFQARHIATKAWRVVLGRSSWDAPRARQ